MKDILGQVMALKRPNLLVQAARFGVDEYRRDRHLRRCLGCESAPSPGQALMALLDLEKQLNHERATKSGAYHAPRHIDILTAIMSEAALFRETAVPKLQLVARTPTPV